MKLEIINLQKHYPIEQNKIKKLVRRVLKIEKRDAELNLVFIDNKGIKEINKKFLGHNYATDVLSFAYHESPLNNTIAGEILVSVEMAVQQAQNRACSAEGEIALYLIHGVLHLLGYDDKKKGDAKRMHQREGDLLARLGYRVPVPD
ncbi:MAG: rRNA maturation RNase YbeY [Candidatus Brocadia sp. WS118]|nr:MAG: rRNA maturation RNase YbeY [Candidatus Brocadia sp. WS118]